MDRGAWQATVLGITRVQHDLAIKPPTTTTIYIYLYPFPLQVVYSAPSPCTFPSFFLFLPLPSFCFFFLKIIPILLKSYSVYDLFHSLVYLINCLCVRTRACMCAHVCSVLSNSCGPMDCSLLGSAVHGIFQARILEQVAIS